MQTTDLANTSIPTIRLVELAIWGLESQISCLINDKARLLNELADLRGEQSKPIPPKPTVKWKVVKPKGRPPVPTACKQCGEMYPSGLAARGHCVGKAKTPQKKVAKSD